jgi:hypothetical protein
MYEKVRCGQAGVPAAQVADGKLDTPATPHGIALGSIARSQNAFGFQLSPSRRAFCRRFTNRLMLV